jgi:hypothetical protein
LGLIQIKAKRHVYRRYCAIEDVLALALLPNGPESDSIFSTGGDLIELGDLAKLVAELVNPNAEIRRQIDPELPSDDYYSDSKDWDDRSKYAKLAKDSISDQVLRVSGVS